MAKFERNSIEHHHNLGLPKNVDLRATLSIVTPSHNRRKEILHFHTFAMVTEDNRK